jgi:hypothetical protein
VVSAVVGDLLAQAGPEEGLGGVSKAHPHRRSLSAGDGCNTGTDSRNAVRAPEHRPHGATWLNGERWEDEIESAATANGIQAHAEPLATKSIDELKAEREHRRKLEGFANA